MEKEYRCKGDPRARPPDFEGRTFIYPKPLEVVKAALGKLEQDGSVVIIDDETNEPFALEPYDPVPIDELHQDIWCRHVLVVAKQIEDLCRCMGQGMHPQARPDEVRVMEHKLESMAHYLSAYRYAPAFLEKVSTLVQITEDGIIHHPQLPGGSWAFAPENIAFRDQPSSGSLSPSPTINQR